MPALPDTMQALIIQHPLASDFSNLTVEQRPVLKPTGTQVLVRVKAVSLNARDAQIASGTYPAPIQVQAGIVAGSDAAGDIVAVGEGVSRVQIGDRVTPIFSQSFLHGDFDPDYQKSGLGGGLDGVLREYFLCDESGVVSIPEHLTYEQACCSVITGVTSWHCLYGHKDKLETGQTVLAMGTGGVSLYAAQLALAAGCEVIVTSSSDEKLERARRELAGLGGRIKTLNYRTIPEWEKEVRKLTGGRGVDHVIEIGGAGTLVRSIRSCRPGGNVWVVGYMSDYPTGAVSGQEQPEYAKEILYSQGQSFLPSTLLPRPGPDLTVFPPLVAVVRGVVCGSRDMFEDMNRCVEINKIVPIVDKVFPFEQAQEAYRFLDSGKHFGKVVISLEK
ncbi:hypothetical protein JCM10213_007938 [Rhodosporidiobolus nylandii]